MRVKGTVSIFAFAFMVGATSASAQHMNEPNAPCRNVGSGAETTNCFAAAQKAADNNLNRTYGKIRKVLEGAELDRLQQSQRAWLTYRDGFCESEYDLYGGGTGGPTTRFACLEALRRHHEEDLKAAYGWRVAKFSNTP